VGGPSTTGYPTSGDLSIAYQVVGDGSLDVVFVPSFVSHLDIGWELVPVVKTLTRLSSFAARRSGGRLATRKREADRQSGRGCPPRR
jgi:hypothetical protein